MADEFEFLTVNAAGDSWVDSVPGAVSTGYQNQNTNIEAGRMGIDTTFIFTNFVGTSVTLKAGGVVDVDGVPFTIKSDLSINLSGVDGQNLWIYLADGSTSQDKTVALTTTPPEWDESKGGYYTSAGKRVLSWIITPQSSGNTNVTVNVYRLAGQGNYPGAFKQPTHIKQFARKADIQYPVWLNFEKNGVLTTITKQDTGGICFDPVSQYIIVPSRDDDRIYRASLVTGAFVDFISSPSVGPIACAWDVRNNNLISADFVNGFVYEHDGFSSTILSSKDYYNAFSIFDASNPLSGIEMDEETGNFIVAGLNVAKAQIWTDPTGGTKQDEFDVPVGGVYGDIALSPSGDLLVCDGANISIMRGKSDDVMGSFAPGVTYPILGITCDYHTGAIYWSEGAPSAGQIRGRGL
jgi:hypothetical protein